MTLQWAAFPNPAAVSTVIIGPAGQGTVNWTPGSTTATVTGLGCQAYTFTIASKGPGGTSASATFPVAMGCTVPATPAPPSIGSSPDPTWLVVNWQGVAGATSYDVTATNRQIPGSVPGDGAHTVNATGTTATIGSLYMGQTYAVTVMAKNTAGSSGVSGSVSGITGWNRQTSVRVDMSSYTNIRACNPSATSGSTVCNAWLMKSPTIWTNNSGPPPTGNEYTALNQGTSIGIICGKQGTVVTGTGGANAGTWLLNTGNGYIGWLSDGWIQGGNSAIAGVPTCNF